MNLIHGLLQVVVLPSAHSVASAAPGGSQHSTAAPSVCFTVDAGVYLPRQVSSKDGAQVEAVANDTSRINVVRD